MPLDITVPTVNGRADERNLLWLAINRHRWDEKVDPRSRMALSYQ
jgi:hypothetical protein